MIGTAGHIDHGKTTLLRALTGIDADRLPEERRRGMTIDVGYAHLTLPDGSVLDFVDVPGHDRLVGNMLVGAGEVDAALLVIAADDGPNAQTREHLELLDAIGLEDGVVVVTKIDLVDAARTAEVLREAVALVGRTRLACVQVVPVSSITGEGLGALREELAAVRDRVVTRNAPAASSGPRISIDRVFTVKGRGTVVTGSLRGGAVAPGDLLRLVPGDIEVRVREVQERGAPVPGATGGRTALLLGGIDPDVLRRGLVLAADPSVVATSRLLVALRPPPRLGHGPSVAPPVDRERLRLHLGTEQAGAMVIRGPREAIELPDGSTVALVRLDVEIAASAGDRFALRRPSPGSAAGGGVILDPLPPRGVSRRRLRADRVAALLSAPAAKPGAIVAARLDLHGALHDGAGGGWRLAPDVAAALAGFAVALVGAHHAAQPESPGVPLPALRAEVALAARRRVTLRRPDADEVARNVVEDVLAGGAVAREGDRVRDPARPAGPSPRPCGRDGPPGGIAGGGGAATARGSGKRRGLPAGGDPGAGGGGTPRPAPG